MRKLLIVACLLFALPLSAGTIKLTQDTVWSFPQPAIVADDIDLNGHSLNISLGDPFHPSELILSGRVSGKGSLGIGGLTSTLIVTGPLDLDGPVGIAVGHVFLRNTNHFHGGLSLAEAGVRPGTTFVEDAGAIPAGTPLALNATLDMGPYSLDVSSLNGRTNDIPRRVELLLRGGTLTVSGSGPSNFGGFIDGYGAIIVTGNLHCIRGGGQFAGSIQIAGGTMTLEQSGFSIDAPITIPSGTLRLFQGGSGSVSIDAGVLEVSVDVFNPVSNGIGQLSLTSSSRFIASVTEFRKTIPMLLIISSITLGNSVLDFRPPSHEFPRDTVVIIRNEGTQPVNDTFAGLPEGATFTVDGGIYRINYHGGTGGDVTVRTLNVATATTLTGEPVSLLTPQFATLHSVTRRTRSASGIPAGSAAFYDGDNLLGTALIDPAGAATFRTPALRPGTHTLTAQFTGSSSDAPSTSAPVSYVVNIPVPTFRVTLTSSNNPSVAGVPVPVYAFVATDSGPSDGTVDLMDGSMTLNTLAVTVPGGVAFSPVFTPGLHSLYAIYRPSNGIGGTTSEPLLQNIVENDATRTTFTAFPNPASSGEPVQLTAAVRASAGVPWGRVTFFDDATPLDSVAVDAAGTASTTVRGLKGGMHQLTARYDGVERFTPSVSPMVPLTVQFCSAPVIVAPPANASVVRGGSMTLTITTRGDEPQRIEWFRGTYPDTANPLGQGASLTLQNVLATTAVWVRASNTCGLAYTAATVTVVERRRRSAGL
jgi:hypothetical protein